MTEWTFYDVECHQGTSTQTVVIRVLARDYVHACQQARLHGYTPVMAGKVQ